MARRWSPFTLLLAENLRRHFSGNISGNGPGVLLESPSELSFLFATAGGDNVGRSSENLVKAALMQSQVRLCAFLLAPSSSIQAQLTADKLDMFVSLVEESGGVLFGRRSHGNPFGPLEGFNYLYNDDNREKVKVWTQWLNIQINEFWTLDLSASPSAKKRNIKIEIVSREGTARKDVGIAYPRLLPPQR